MESASLDLIRPSKFPSKRAVAEAARRAREPASLTISDEGERLGMGVRFYTYTLHSQVLPDDRAVYVYLPEAYWAEPERRFAVFYLNDGQNLFDGRLSYIADRTWRADKTADRLTAEGEIEPVILVGVANTGLRRMAEYTPTKDFKMAGGEGRSYGRLLREELKPRIDGLFRTLAGPESTALGGSSLGGLISLYLGLEERETFGKVAVMSPSIWWDGRSILRLVARARPGGLRIWLDMGTAEGARHVRDTEDVHDLLVTRGWRDGDDLAYLSVTDGVHDEDAWAGRFDQVLRFLFASHRR